MIRRFGVAISLTVLAAMCLLVLAPANAASTKPGRRPTAKPYSLTTDYLGISKSQAEIVVDYYLTTLAIGEYVFSVERQEVADYIVAVQRSEFIAEQNALGRYLGSRRAPNTPRYASPAPPQSNGGGSCGGAGNADRFIGRESGGNAYIVNPGNRTAPDPYSAGAAWGCYQIIPSTWASSCGDITTYDPASQARCAARLPSSAWASSGSTG